jgi:hypothetical protein
MFEIKAGVYPSKMLVRCSTHGRLLALPTNNRLGWKGFPGAKSVFLRKFVTYGRKKFYRIGPRMKSQKEKRRIKFFTRLLG